MFSSPVLHLDSNSESPYYGSKFFFLAKVRIISEVLNKVIKEKSNQEKELIIVTSALVVLLSASKVQPLIPICDTSIIVSWVVM